MADQKISALTEVTAPAASDVLPIVNSSTTKKVQLQNAVKVGNVALWARVFHSTSQSISHDTLTALSFNSERADTDTIHDNSTNNSRLKATSSGVYVITGVVDFAANATGLRSIHIRHGGSTFIAGQETNAVSGIATRLNVSTVYAMAANEYVELLVYQNSGGSLSIPSTANVSPEFSMIRIGA